MTPLDPSRSAKLNALATQTTASAENHEKNGNVVEAIDQYLKAVDILLLLAQASADYPTWLRLTDKAQEYQKKVRVLIATAAIREEENTTSPAEIRSSVADNKVSGQT